MKLFTKLTDKALTEAVSAGGVGVLPCDTVYGLVCSAANPQAVGRLYMLAHNNPQPVTLIAADFDQLVELGFKRRYLVAVQQYWPAAVSVMIPCGTELQYIHQGTDSVAVRIPEGSDLQALLTQAGPLLTSISYVPNKTEADSLDFYVEGADLSGRLPSTIIRVIDDAIEVVRRGAVDIEAA